MQALRDRGRAGPDDMIELDVLTESTDDVKPKRTRRATLDTRTPADFVPVDDRTRVAAMYYLMRKKKNARRPWWGVTSLYQRYEDQVWLWQLYGRLSRYPGLITSRFGHMYPAPSEVAPCCHSVKMNSKYKYAFLSHVRSAAHLAQHFKVNARDIIHEASMHEIAAALDVNRGQDQ